jgi:hypothetical protein
MSCHRKHPAAVIYEELAEKALSGTRVPTYPDPVGSSTLRATLRARGVNFPDSFVDFRVWCVDVGVQAAARRVKKNWDKRRGAK